MGSTEDTMGTMTSVPFVNHVPTMVGGYGQKMVSYFYENHFIFQNPTMELERVKRTVGQASLVDELIVTVVHDTDIDWLLPGVDPTGMKIVFPLVVSVNFEQLKLGAEDRVDDEFDGWRMASESI